MNERILIVEDEPQMLRLLGMTLQKEGYQISAAQSAAAAKAQLQAGIPDLIVLDVMLPDVSGLDLCQELRRMPTTAAVPILMLSALGQVADKVAGLKAGADEYVVKPIDSLELTARVGALLERARRMRGDSAGPRGKVIAFLAGKGGVGTTTSLVSIGAAMAALGKRVVAAELRPDQGQLSTLLNLGTGESTQGLLALDAAQIDSRSISGWVLSHTSGLQALPAPQAMRPDLHLDARQALAIALALTGLAEVVLVDLPPGPSPASEAVLGISDRILLTIEPTRLGLETAFVMAAYAKAHARPAAELSVLVINRVPLASPLAARQIQERLGWTVAGGIPPAPDECARAQQLGAPVVQAAPDSTISQTFNTLARTLA
jgi:DNA-binding response OmpR family regulator